MPQDFYWFLLQAKKRFSLPFTKEYGLFVHFVVGDSGSGGCFLLAMLVFPLKHWRLTTVKDLRYWS